MRNHKRIPIFFLGLASLCMAGLACSANLGVEGAIYSIEEPDMLAGIRQKLQSLQESGELEREKRRVIQRSVAHILRPNPVLGVTDLPKGEAPKPRYFDPSIVLNNDIKSDEGIVFARVGQRVNPLEHMRFREMLLFINGDNASQLDWANALLHSPKVVGAKKVKIILVKGDIKTTSERIKHQVYFDQYGALCHHFHIIHTPTQVWQPEGEKRLMVQEVRVD